MELFRPKPNPCEIPLLHLPAVIWNLVVHDDYYYRGSGDVMCQDFADYGFYFFAAKMLMMLIVMALMLNSVGGDLFKPTIIVPR